MIADSEDLVRWLQARIPADEIDILGGEVEVAVTWVPAWLSEILPCAPEALVLVGSPYERPHEALDAVVDGHLDADEIRIAAWICRLVGEALRREGVCR